MKQLSYLFLLGLLITACSESGSEDSENSNNDLHIPGIHDSGIPDSCYAVNAVGPLKLGISAPDSTYYINDSVSESLIRKTMSEIDWEVFHLVWVEDKYDCHVEVGGSIYEDGLGVSYQRYRQEDGKFLCEMINTNPLDSVYQLTEILVSYCNGTEDWYTKNNFE